MLVWGWEWCVGKSTGALFGSEVGILVVRVVTVTSKLMDEGRAEQGPRCSHSQSPVKFLEYIFGFCETHHVTSLPLAGAAFC